VIKRQKFILGFYQCYSNQSCDTELNKICTWSWNLKR